MKKLLMLVAVLLGTTAMVNAQVQPAKTTTTKEVKAVKHAKRVKKAKKVRAAKEEQAEMKAAAKK